MIYPEIDPVMLAVGPLELRWYGMMYLIGFVGGWWLGRIRAAASNSAWTKEMVDDLLFYIALGVVLGGRLGYTFFYNFPSFIDNPLILFKIWEGGMAFHGGFLGVLVAMYLFGRKYQKTFWTTTDFIAPYVTIGLGAGRIGNFINGELWGAPTDVPWAMQVPCTSKFYDLCTNKLQLPEGTLMTPPLHPNQLYEAFLEGLVLFLILWFYSAKPRPRMAVSAVFLISYGVFRFGVEFVRMPDSHLGYLAFDWLTMGQLLTAPMILIGIGLLWWAYHRDAKAAAAS